MKIIISENQLDSLYDRVVSYFFEPDEIVDRADDKIWIKNGNQILIYSLSEFSAIVDTERAIQISMVLGINGNETDELIWFWLRKHYGLKVGKIYRFPFENN